MSREEERDRNEWEEEKKRKNSKEKGKSFWTHSPKCTHHHFALYPRRVTVAEDVVLCFVDTVFLCVITDFFCWEDLFLFEEEEEEEEGRCTAMVVVEGDFDCFPAEVCFFDMETWDFCCGRITVIVEEEEEEEEGVDVRSRITLDFGFFTGFLDEGVMIWTEEEDEVAGSGAERG